MGKKGTDFRTYGEFREYQQTKAIADLMRLTGYEGKVAGDKLLRDFALKKAQSNRFYAKVGRII